MMFSENIWNALMSLGPEEVQAVDDRIRSRRGNPDASLILHAVRQFVAGQPCKEDLWHAAFGPLPHDPQRLRDGITSLRGFLRGHLGGIGRIKLVKWLRRLLPDERLRFLGYATGMYGTQNPAALDLLRTLIGGGLVDGDVSREQLHALSWGAVSFREQAITATCHFLLRALKEFLAVQNLLKSPIDTRMRLAKELQTRGWYPELESQLEEIGERMEEVQVDEDSELMRLQAVELSIAHSLATDPAVDISSRYEWALWHQQESALMNMVRLVTAHFSNKSSRSHRAPHDASTQSGTLPASMGLEQAIQWIDAVRDLGQPHGLLLRCSLLSLDMLRDTTHAMHFNRLRTIIRDEGGQLADSMRADMYRHLFNWAQEQTRAGRMEFDEVLGEMYEEVADTDLLLRGGQMQPNRLRILVLVLCRTGKVELARTEYERLKKHLPKGAPPTVHELCKGIIAFYSGDYESANRLFSIVLIQPDPVRFLLDARMYQVEISLLRLEEELPLMERILDYRAAFEYLERNLGTFMDAKRGEIGDVDWLGVKHFRRYCRLMYAIQVSPNKRRIPARLQKIGMHLEQEPNLYHRSFLNEYMKKVMAAHP